MIISIIWDFGKTGLTASAGKPQRCSHLGTKLTRSYPLTLELLYTFFLFPTPTIMTSNILWAESVQHTQPKFTLSIITNNNLENRSMF